jgi:hypothetical protein
MAARHQFHFDEILNPFDIHAAPLTGERRHVINNRASDRGDVLQDVVFQRLTIGQAQLGAKGVDDGVLNPREIKRNDAGVTFTNQPFMRRKQHARDS